MGKFVMVALYGLMFPGFMVAVLWAPSWFALVKILAVGAALVAAVVVAFVVAAYMTAVELGIGEDDAGTADA